MARATRNDGFHPLLITIKNLMVLDVRTTDDRDLSQRQMAIFLIVATEPDNEHTVRGLAAHLNITKPAITRALDRLSQLDLVARHDDPKDGRSILVRRTSEGAKYLKALGTLASKAEIATSKE